jgi:hypothetical protein
MPGSWGESFGQSFGESFGGAEAVVAPTTNPHSGGAGMGGRSRGSPGGGGDNEWHKRLRAEIEALLTDETPDGDDIRDLGRKIEARGDVPEAVFDAAHEMAVSEAIMSAENVALLLEKLAILDQWLAEQAEIARLEQIEIEAEEFLLLVS